MIEKRKFLSKNLRIWEKSSNFARFFEKAGRCDIVWMV